jgi:aspartate aminotransferase
MFSDLDTLPGDPILALMAAYREDESPQKVDLGVGIYQDESGATPVLEAVRRAEAILLETQTTKAYVGIAGSPQFNDAMTRLAFGDDHPALADGRIRTVQTTGGSGGLRVAAELIDRVRPGATVWVSTPTWPNHVPLLTAAGLSIREYPYYDAASGRIDEAAMFEALERIPEGDVLLLHGCCHNPTGADLNGDQWARVADICAARNLLPFIDSAYQGFGDGLDEDAAGLRLMASRVPELLAVNSCSKNFGLYRERVGSLSMLVEHAGAAAAGLSHLLKIVRAMISMPPDHGAATVATILESDALRGTWHAELGEMRGRINMQRRALCDALKRHGAGDRFDFIAGQRGMFSLLGIERALIDRLRDESHIYIVGSGRINVAGITGRNVDYIAESLVGVLPGA